MTKKKISYIKYIACFLVAVMLFTACSWLNTDVESAIIYLNQAEKYIWWQSISGVERYDVYLNNSKLTSIDAQTGTTIFDYTDVCTQTDTYYSFKVKSVSYTYGTSDFSNTLSVIIESPIENSDALYNAGMLTTDSTKGVSGVQLSTGGALTWNTVADAKGYVVITYKGLDNYNFYYVTGNALRLNRVPNENADVLAVKVGAVYENDDNVYVSTDGLKYYNPISKGEYTNSSAIYLFDGEIHDKYITSDAELRNYAYYNFISRNNEYDLMLSAKYKNTIVSTRTSIPSYIQSIIANAYLETYMYNTSLPIVQSKANEQLYVYQVTWVISAHEECVLKTKDGKQVGISKDLDLQQYLNSTPYYGRLNYTKRDANFNSFASDYEFLSIEVKTSEELFWAVEGGFAPVPKAGSRAETIYNAAKQVLREIISDDMTDYEKALCIHDYLCMNYVYDYYSLGNTKDNMDYTCYYLEGLFMDANKLVVCDGYAKVFSLLCNMEGIDCIRVTGKVSGGGHAWNKVEIDGVWYIVDVTNTEIKYGRVIKTVGDHNMEIPTQEVLAHELFLVGDDEISSYVPFANRPRNFYNDCDDNYHYYDNDNNSQKLYITSTEELYAFLDYCYAYNYGMIDFAIEYQYYSWLVSTYKVENNRIYTYFDKVMTEYYQDKVWADMPGYLFGSYTTNRTSTTAVITIFSGMKLNLDEMEQEKLEAYNAFVEAYFNQD